MSVGKALLTGVDGETHDIGRWFAAVVGVTGLALEVYAVVWKGQAFDMQAYGVGASALALGIGGMLKLKADTEPKPGA